MGYIYDDWKKLLDTFQQCVEKDLEEIHKHKAEVQEIKSDILSRLDNGIYYRNNNRILLSAPEIIIGNVDRSGDLQGNIGHVIIKGSDVKLEGVGNSGTIISRAPSIRQIAVNPGIDGLENVVCETSEIVSQAGSIALHSSDATDAFSQDGITTGRGGVWIHADQELTMEAAVTNDLRKKDIEVQIKSLTQEATNLNKQLEKQKKDIDKFFTEMKKLHEAEEKINIPDFYAVRVNAGTIDEIHDRMDEIMPSLYQSTVSFIRSVSMLAEVNRKKKALEQEKNVLKETNDFKKNTTGASMTITAENISIATADGDGNLHTNDEAGISIRTPRYGLSMIDDQGKLVEKGSYNVNSKNISLTSFEEKDKGKEHPVVGNVKIQAKDINLEAVDYQADDKGLKEKELTKDGKLTMTFKTVEVSTANPQNIERDKDGKLTKGEFKGEGDVIIRSKTVTMESLDYEVADGKLKTKALTKDGKLSIRTEKTNIIAADAEGKATGSVNVNAKAVSVKSMDVDKEKLTDSKLAAGSTMTLVSEKMYVGSKSKDIKSKKVQTVSEEVGLFADKTLEIQQGDGKALVQLDGGNASVGGSKTQIYGDTTINGKTDIKGDVKAPKAVIDNIEAKSSFKSTNISDGIAVPGAGGGGSLSAKLKSEDAPKE